VFFILQVVVMRELQFRVVAKWDTEANVWYVAATNVPGLSTEADTIEQLNKKLMVMIPELLILTGVLKKKNNDYPEVPYELIIPARN